MTRFGSLRWMVLRNPNSSSCAARISSRIGHRTASSSLSFLPAGITVSSASSTLPRNPFPSLHQPWIPMEAWPGRSMASASLLSASRPRSATPHKATSSPPVKPHPGPIWVADASTRAAKEIWHGSATPQGSFPFMAEDTGGSVLNWGADNQIVMASEEDGWQHLYALSADGGAPKLLTPGNCEVEQWSFTPDKKTLLFNSNCGDVDRRHIWTIPVTGGSASQLTSGKGVEWSPVALNDGKTLTYIGSEVTSPARPFATTLSSGHSSTALAPETWPKDFPSHSLV